MCHKIGKLLVLFGLLASSGGGLPVLAQYGPLQMIEIPLPAGYRAWIDALEAEVEPGSTWVFPFEAPRPADLTTQELKIVLSLRRLILNEELAELESLTDQVERRQEPKPAQMLFWLAYAQGRLQKNHPGLANLELLLAIPEGWRNLESGQIAWVLTGTPDLIFLLGDRDRASRYYRRLADSSVEQLNLWGNYQLAGMDFLERNFEQAGRKYALVCQSEKPETWRKHACAMAEIAGRLSRRGKEAETDDTVSILGP